MSGWNDREPPVFRRNLVMRPTLVLPSILLAALAVPSIAAAQAPAWNRRVSDIRIVHPPATPPGTYRVETDLWVAADDAQPAGTNLSMEITLSLNGTPIQTASDGETTLSPIQCYSGGQCQVAQPCTGWDNPQGPPFPGVCDDLPVKYNGQWWPMCACYHYLLWVSDPWVFNPGDHLDLVVSPSPGALAELATDDDAMEIVVGDNVPGTPYCSGDGTLATPCPCGNTGASGHGCANSVNPSGALLGSTGFVEPDPVTGTDSVVLHGSGMPATATVVYLKGANTNVNGAIYGDGLRCVTGPFVRLAVKINVGGSSRFPEPGDPSLSARGGTPYGSGLSAYYQAYYRNPQSFCTPATFNITNGVRIDW
jgi:hypothetical protein